MDEVNQTITPATPAPTPAPVASAPLGPLEKKARRSFILGIVGLLAWLIPLFGFPVTIVGIVFGVKGLPSTKHKKAVAGLTMSIIGLVLTIINAAIGAYMGATGQHPLVNQMMGEPNQAQLESGNQAPAADMMQR